MNKKCGRCGEIKLVSEFYKNTNGGKNGLQSYCKTCKDICNTNYRKNSLKCQERMKKYDKKRRQSMHGKYLRYRQKAKERDYVFALSEIDFALLISSPCYYCGKLQENFNGVDRVDNRRGYILDNCVSCCEDCNKMKMTRTKEEFIMKCKKITEKQEVMTYST